MFVSDGVEGEAKSLSTEIQEAPDAEPAHKNVHFQGIVISMLYGSVPYPIRFHQFFVGFCEALVFMYIAGL